MAEEQSREISRRDFIKGAATGTVVGLVIGGGGVALFKPDGEVKPWIPEKWDEEADVVIVGSGAAGLTAAINARMAGAEVLVLEKMPFRGGNTSISTAWMNAVESLVQKERGIKSWSKDKFYNWTMMGGDNKGNPAQVRVYADQSGDGVGMLYDMGAPFPFVDAYAHAVTEEWGAGLIKFLSDNADEVGVTVLINTKVTGLVADIAVTPPQVLGITVTDSNGETKNIKAKRALILAAGGFGANPEVIDKYDPSLKGFATTNIPGVSTGECLGMALSLGADTAGINYVQIHPTVYAFEGKAAMITEAVRVAGAILINADGERFCDEMHRRDVVSVNIMKQKEKYAFLIGSEDVYHKKIDSYYESGYVVKANTLAELATEIGLDPAKLEKAVNTYNSYVEAGEDPEFQRGVYREMGERPLLPAKIETPPFYGIKVTPGVHHCCGGLKINPKAQVIHAQGKAIGRLYAGGEVAGGIHGTNRMGGNAITECIVFGRIAGQNAAAEEPWE